MLSSYDNLEITDLPSLQGALGDTYNELIRFNKELGIYEITSLEELKDVIANDQSISPKSRNEYLAKIDKELRDTNIDTVLRDIGRNYNDVSEEAIKKLADSLKEDYDTVKAWFTYNEATGKENLIKNVGDNNL